MFLRVRFILTDKTEGFLFPGSVDGSTNTSRALYQHRQDRWAGWLAWLGWLAGWAGWLAGAEAGGIGLAVPRESAGLSWL